MYVPLPAPFAPTMSSKAARCQSGFSSQRMARFVTRASGMLVSS